MLEFSRMDSSDQKLIDDYLSGDERSLEVLFGRYLKLIYGFIYRYAGGNAQDTEDITQDVFVKVWHNLKKFDRQKNFKTWIFAIAKNTAIDFIKKKKIIPFSKFENEEGENILMETVTDPAPSPLELLEKSDIARMVNLAIEKLSLKYRLALFLRYNNDFTFREIAESLGESLNTVKSRHRRALVMLKNLLSESES